MSNVYIVGGDYGIERMFLKNQWGIVDGLHDEPDLVVFTGGADVSPELYGERNFASGNDKRRDELERLVYLRTLELNIPMAGICRGAQFLNVMNGGKMYQDAKGHAIGGTHPIMDIGSGETIQVTSTHHQMMKPIDNANYELVAFAQLNKEKRHLMNDMVTSHSDGIDFEVLYYEDTDCLCFQPHPEYGVKSCEDYFFKLLETKLELH